MIAVLHSAVLPLLPPVVQQRITQDPALLDKVVLLEGKAGDASDPTGASSSSYPTSTYTLRIHDEILLVADVEALRTLQRSGTITELLSRKRLWNISGREDVVLQPGLDREALGAALFASRVKQNDGQSAWKPITCRVVYVKDKLQRSRDKTDEGEEQGEAEDITTTREIFNSVELDESKVQEQEIEPEVELSVPSTMTGLQLKSMVLSELSLTGGFQNYVLTCDGNPFASRVPVSSMPSFKTGCTLILEDIGDRPKPEGRT